MSTRPCFGPFGASGLSQVLATKDFGEWETTTARTLGHHRSRLLEPQTCFQARYRLGRADALGVLHIQGSGRLELQRTKTQGGVLWLPLYGFSQERINGNLLLAEPGMALLLRPGDELVGVSSHELEGVSVLLPEALVPGTGASLLHRGLRAREVIVQAMALAEATALGQLGLVHGALALVEALRSWQQEQGEPEAGGRERPSAARGRALVNEAILWMVAHLGEPFTVKELARSLSISVRALQYAFQQELGHPPLAEARRLRLRMLRRRLLEPDDLHLSIGMLMADYGLLGGGSTARDYRRFCGELPRQTRHRVMERLAVRTERHATMRLREAPDGIGPDDTVADSLTVI
jgi:AraC-like DNA-binding protein